MQQIYHKKNELFEVQFYKDKECTEAFDFKNAKNLYIELKDGDCTPLFYLPKGHCSKQKIFTPYLNSYIDLPIKKEDCCDTGFWWNIITLDDITPNLSKYIPEDNAVLFLSEEDFLSYKDCIQRMRSVFFKDENNQFQTSYGLTGNLATKEFDHLYRKRFIIFLTNGTQSKLQKANEVAKELKEKYGVEEVNLVVLHCFVKFENLSFGAIKLAISREYDIDNFNFNKIITTNSTGILPVQDNERLQVIDCKEIFEEYLKENN